MFLELIGTILAGVAVAGALLAILRLTGNRLPRWIVPLGAGAAMLIATISSEYGWFARAKSNLPQGVIVAESVETQAPYRPWTYVKPFVTRFVAVDSGGARENSNTPGLYLTDLYFYGRWQPVRSLQVMVNCTTHARAEPMQDGAATPVWREVGPDDPVVGAVCAGRV